MVFLGLPASSFSPVSISFSMKPWNRPSTDEPTFGSSQRLMFQRTCSALSASPFDHLTSLLQHSGSRSSDLRWVPSFEQDRNGDAVALRAGQVVVGLAHDVRIVDPGEGRRIVERRNARTDTQDAALLRGRIAIRLPTAFRRSSSFFCFSSPQAAYQASPCWHSCPAASPCAGTRGARYAVSPAHRRASEYLNGKRSPLPDRKDI